MEMQSKLILKTIALSSNKNDLIINANGTLFNAFDTKNLQYDLSIPGVTVSKSIIDPLINNAGKQYINLPPSITIAGKIKGDLKQLYNDLVITSAYGTAATKGTLKNFTNSQEPCL